MSLSLQDLARPVVSGLALVGNYFNSLNRFSSTFNIAGLVAKEWAYRFPNSHSNLNEFVNICSSFKIHYLREFFSLPSRFNERSESETFLDISKTTENLNKIIKNFVENKKKKEGKNQKLDTFEQSLINIYSKNIINELVVNNKKSKKYSYDMSVKILKTLSFNDIVSDCFYDDDEGNKVQLIDKEEIKDTIASLELVPSKSWLKPMIEWNKGIVYVSSFLCLLNQVELINLSKWATSIGKIPGFGRINQLNMVQSIIFGCISYSLLSVIHFSNEVYIESKIGIYDKKNWCSLAQSAIETDFYSFLLFASKYKALNQSTLIRVMIVVKEFFSGIVLDFIKTK